MSSWREIIKRAYLTRPNTSGTESKPMFYPAASISDIEAAENRLNAILPGTLKSLLLETDGVMDMLSVDAGPYFDNTWLFWRIQQIIDENLAFRRRNETSNAEQDAREFLFFAGAGVDGILFGLKASAEKPNDAQIVCWYPIEEQIRSVADTLADFIDGWLTNRITV